MSEKVKVTREQAKAIELRTNKESAIEQHMIHGWYSPCNKPLESLTLDELIRALYIGYEVEPEFKVGDWVTAEFNFGKVTGKLVLVEGGYRVDSSKYNVPQSIPLGDLRHATPEEIKQEKRRRWWAKHDRDTSQIKPGDILIKKIDNFPVVNLRHGLLDDSMYKVACFAENRLDGDSDE